MNTEEKLLDQLIDDLEKAKVIANRIENRLKKWLIDDHLDKLEKCKSDNDISGK